MLWHMFYSGKTDPISRVMGMRLYYPLVRDAQGRGNDESMRRLASDLRALCEGTSADHGRAEITEVFRNVNPAMLSFLERRTGDRVGRCGSLRDGRSVIEVLLMASTCAEDTASVREVDETEEDRDCAVDTVAAYEGTSKEAARELLKPWTAVEHQTLRSIFDNTAAAPGLYTALPTDKDRQPAEPRPAAAAAQYQQ